MAFRKFTKRFPRRRRFPTRSRTRPPEVSNFAHSFSLELTAGESTDASPAIYVTPVCSLSSLVTDFDRVTLLTRSIPPQYRGLSVLKASLDVTIEVQSLPSTRALSTVNNAGWAGGYARVGFLFYVDDFTWSGGIENPDLSVIHPLQNDLISGATHTEHDRPTRILKRHSTLFPAECDGVIDPTTGNLTALQHRNNFIQKWRVGLRKIFLTERSSLWFCIWGTNPWAGPNPAFDIHVGWQITGPVVYRLRTA